MSDSSYFDYMASTPVHPEVRDVMTRYLSDGYFANPHSPHQMGLNCQKIIQDFTAEMLSHLGAKSGDLVWTSGATESINLALLGIAEQYQYAGKHIVSVVTEHSATLETLDVLKKRGFDITLLSVKSDGCLNLQSLRDALRPDTILVTLMHVHNEIGVIHDIAKISSICSEHGALLHVDYAQTIGKVPFILHQGVSYASFSAHKCYGPNGIGALYISKPKRLKRQIHGGSQQHHRRAGTLPLFLIAGFVKAVELSQQSVEQHMHRYVHFHQYCLQNLSSCITLNGSCEHRVPQNLHLLLPESVSFHDLDTLKNNYSLSSHSACNLHATSHVLDALGLNPQEQKRCLRVSFGFSTTFEHIQKLIHAINAIV